MKTTRIIYKTDEYQFFYDNLESRVVKKINYLERTEKIISSKIAKKLINTDLYELRVLLNDQYRILFFTLDSEDLNQFTELLFISGFIKKSTKDYKKQIKRNSKVHWTVCSIVFLFFPNKSV